MIKADVIILVKVPQRVHYVKYCTRAWARGKYSTWWSRVLYLASKPCPSAIFHVVHECMWYFNWFIVFPFFFLIFVQCLANVFSFVCKFCFLEMDSGKSSLLAFCVLEYGILSTKKTWILTLEWAIGLAMATTMTCCSAIALAMATMITLWRFFTRLLVNRNCKTVTGLCKWRFLLG